MRSNCSSLHWYEVTRFGQKVKKFLTRPSKCFALLWFARYFVLSTLKGLRIQHPSIMTKKRWEHLAHWMEFFVLEWFSSFPIKVDEETSISMGLSVHTSKKYTFLHFIRNVLTTEKTSKRKLCRVGMKWRNSQRILSVFCCECKSFQHTYTQNE